MKTVTKRIALFLAICSLLSLCACAKEETKGDVVGDLVYYLQSDGTYSVGVWSKNAESITSVTVPAQHNGKNVTAIVANGFANCILLRDVTLPATIRTLHDFSFSNCSSLENVTFNEGVERIGKYAFSGCHSLRLANIPDSVVTLEEHAYSFCSRLSTVKLSSKMTVLAAYTFYKCDSLCEVSIPDQITTVEPYAFENCAGLSNVTVGSGVETFDADIVKDCPALARITMDEENASYYSASGVLYDKASNEIVLVPANLGGDIVIPQGVAKIKASMFANRRELTSVTLPQSVTYVGSCAFWGCESLDRVIVESTVGWMVDDQQPVSSAMLENPEAAAEYFLDEKQMTATYKKATE